MYAIVSQPGAQNFEISKEGSREDCKVWILKRREYLEGEGVNLPTPKILTNKEANALRFRDGQKILDRVSPWIPPSWLD